MMAHNNFLRYYWQYFTPCIDDSQQQQSQQQAYRASQTNDNASRNYWQYFTPCIDDSQQQQSQQQAYRASQTNNASRRKILSNRCAVVTSDSIYAPYSESAIFNTGDSSKEQDSRANLTFNPTAAAMPEKKNNVKTISAGTIPSIPSTTTEVKTRTIVLYKFWDGSQNRWSPPKTYTDEISTCPDSCAAIGTPPNHFRISLRRGGELHVFPNLIDPERVQNVKEELLETKYWRKYLIQGGEEPRLHFLVCWVSDYFDNRIVATRFVSHSHIIVSVDSQLLLRHTKMPQRNLTRNHSQDIDTPISPWRLGLCHQCQNYSSYPKIWRSCETYPMEHGTLGFIQSYSKFLLFEIDLCVLFVLGESHRCFMEIFPIVWLSLFQSRQ